MKYLAKSIHNKVQGAKIDSNDSMQQDTGYQKMNKDTAIIQKMPNNIKVYVLQVA